jgi:hypothetical protein
MASNLFSRLAASISRSPQSANFLAHAAPNPDEAPVIKTVLFMVTSLQITMP